MEHAKTATTCRVESCKEPLELESNAAIGIRLPVSDGGEFVVKTEGLSLEGSEQPTNQSLSGYFLNTVIVFSLVLQSCLRNSYEIFV